MEAPGIEAPGEEALGIEAPGMDGLPPGEGMEDGAEGDGIEGGVLLLETGVEDEPPPQPLNEYRNAKARDQATARRIVDLAAITQREDETLPAHACKAHKCPTATALCQLGEEKSRIDCKILA